MAPGPLLNAKVGGQERASLAVSGRRLIHKGLQPKVGWEPWQREGMASVTPTLQLSTSFHALGLCWGKHAKKTAV